MSRRSGFVFVALLLPGLGSFCRSAPPLQPPTFDYAKLTAQYFRNNPRGHFPLTVQRGANLHPVVTGEGHLFYTSNREGSGDIWMRDLDNTVNLPIIQHPAEQFRPATPASGKFLVFVSEDEDSRGDLRIVALNPAGIVKNMIEGIPPAKYWNLSTNLSTQIEAATESMHEVCRGPAAETDPHVSADGRYLLYASDRCTPGVYNIWRAELSDNEIVGVPIPLTQQGGVQPRFSPDQRFFVFVSYRDSRGGRIHLFDLLRLEERELPIPSGDFIYFEPSVDANNSRIYYSSIRYDTNRNGAIDRNDHGSVFAYELEEPLPGQPREKQLIENNRSILGSSFADFSGGVVLYAAELYDSVNVHLIPPGGIIPEEPNIEEQYRLSTEYRNQSEERYLLSLRAVRQYFGNEPAYLLYEGRVLVDRLEYFELQADRANEDRVRAEIEARSQENPFVALELSLFEAARAGQSRSPVLGRFLQSLEENPDSSPLLVAGTLDRLAQALIEEGRSFQALPLVRRLNEDHPEYYRRTGTLLIEAQLELAQTSEIPAIYNELLTRNPSRKVAETIHSQLVQHYYDNRAAADALESIQRELEDPTLQPLIRASLRIVRANISYDRRDYDASMQECQETLQMVPMVVERGRPSPAPGWNSVFVRAWQIASYVHDKRGEYSAAYAARLTYGGAYSSDATVEIDTEDFLQIIEESESYINVYVRSARALAAVVKDNETEVLGSQAIADTVNALTDRRVAIGSAEMDALVDFCKPNSRTRVLFTSLGPKYAETYLAFCNGNREILENRQTQSVPLPQVRIAFDLLYTASYANANLTNVLFLNMKKLGVLPEVYRERAVYYHRLKTDLAAEKNQLLLEKENVQILGVSRDDIQELFQSTDPFRDQEYEELLYGYRVIEPEATEAGDLSMYYGHAYTLIEKSVNREKFYDRLQAQGVILDSDLQRQTKEEVLRDLKNAEYLLQYILYVDPVNVDAYLLLGWLYQYLDDRRQVSIRTQTTFLEEIVDYFAGARSSLQDGPYYADLYQVYFSDNLYEANIELYRQALEKAGGSDATNIEKAELNLNLANNYFKLLNFKRAIEHYERVESLHAEAGRQSFHGYRQRALFHFNYGRALFYEDKPAEGARELLKAYEIYDEFERKPLHERFSTLRFLMSARGRTINEEGSVSVAALRARMDALAVESDRIRTKMALIAALVGLAYWRAGENEEAILFYRDADYRLYESGEAPRGSVERASLMNFIALAYQSQREFEESDERADLAARYARDRGLTRYDARYEAQTVGGRALGCVLGSTGILEYGEDFSVIGEGRNPYGFSPLRHYELALGIQLENMILKGDLDSAAYLLRQRRQVFLARDFDLRLGKLGYVASLNQEGRNLFENGQYQAAAELFGQAADEARDANIIGSFRLNFASRYKSLFATFEETTDHEATLDTIQDGLEEVAEFRDEYREKIREEFIEERSSEVPEYEFVEERDGPILQARITRRLADITGIEAALLYYAGLQRVAVGESGTEDFDNAIEIYDNAISVLEGSSANRLNVLRLRLNRARAYQARGRLHDARAELTSIVELAYEFNLVREEWTGRTILSEVQLELHKTYRRNEDAVGARENIAEATRILLDHPELQPHLARYAGAFFQYASHYYLTRGNPEQALRLLEWEWEYEISREFFRFPLQFSNEDYKHHFNEVRQLRQTLARLQSDEADLRMQRQNFSRVVARRTKVTDRLRRAEQAFARAAPELQPFILHSDRERPLRPDIATNQALVRLFNYGNETIAWCFHGRNMTYYRSAGTDAEERNREVLGRCLNRPVHDVFVVADSKSFEQPIEELVAQINPTLPRPVFTTRLTDRHVGFLDGQVPSPEEGLFVFNVESKPADPRRLVEANTIDVVELIPDAELLMFSASERLSFNARKWMRDPRFASIAIANPTFEETRPDYRDLAGLYEVLRARGASSLAIGSPGNFQNERSAVLSARGQARLSSSGARIMGSDGFLRSRNLALIERAHREASARGEAYEKSGDLEKASAYYRLASSYLHEHPRRSEIDFHNELNLARIALQIKTGTERTEVTDDLIRRYTQPPKPLRLIEIYSMAIETLLLNGQPELADQYQRGYVAIFPERRQAIENRTRLLEFVARLRKSAYALNTEGNAAFAEDFAAVRSQIIQTANAEEIIEDLIEHRLYEEALRLIADLGRVRGTNSRLISLANQAEAARYLTNPGRRRPNLPPSDDDHIVVKLLRMAGQRNWITYENVVDVHRSDQGLAVTKFQQRLFQQWKNHERHHLIEILDISDVTITEGATAYTLISPLERAMIFRLHLAYAPFDPELETAQSLRTMIVQEARYYSATRAGDLALAASKVYLDIEDFDNATRFFDMFEDQANRRVPRSNQTEERDRLGYLLSFAGETLKDKREAYEKRVATRSPATIELFTALPESFESQNVNAFNEFLQGSARRLPPEDFVLAASILKQRASRTGDALLLLNVAFFEQDVRNYNVARQAGIARDAPSISNHAAGLMSRVPEGQSLVALVDTAGSAYRIINAGAGRARQERLHWSGRFLRGKTRSFLARTRSGLPAAELYYELSREYRALFGVGQTSITYFWFPDIHAFAPIIPERGDRLLQILDPGSMAQRETMLSGKEFRETFPVHVMGEESDDRTRGISGQDELEILERLTTMEELSLGTTLILPVDFAPRHIVYALYGNDASLSGFHRLAERYARFPTAPYFLSANLLLREPTREVGDFNFTMSVMGQSFEGPGVVTVRLPEGIMHPYFIRNYYSRDLPASAIMRRFISAYYGARREAAEVTDLYGYRLVTGNFLREETSPETANHINNQ